MAEGKISIAEHECFNMNTHKTNFVMFQVDPPNGESVKRRYREFAWLSQALNRAVPGAIVPPLPPDTQGTGNVEPGFIKARKDGLESFLNQIQQHSELSGAQCFK